MADDPSGFRRVNLPPWFRDAWNAHADKSVPPPPPSLGDSVVYIFEFDLDIDRDDAIREAVRIAKERIATVDAGGGLPAKE